MAYSMHPILFLLLLLLSSSPPTTLAISFCNGPCSSGDDCDGQLTCINGRCADDPDVGTHICSPGQNPPPGGGGSGSCASKGPYSPPVTSSTSAFLTLNDFSAGGDGGGPSECDDRYHDNRELIVALSTGWFDHRSRCGRMIRITAENGQTTTAEVVDECDSVHGCDPEHAEQRPCDTNIVDGSVGVWNALGLDTNEGRVRVTWSMA